jgi:hypothetical protein
LLKGLDLLAQVLRKGTAMGSGKSLVHLYRCLSQPVLSPEDENGFVRPDLRDINLTVFVRYGHGTPPEPVEI